MMKIKEHGFNISSPDNTVRIRSIAQADLSFYPGWFSKRLTDITPDGFTDAKRERMISKELDGRLTFIVELDAAPSGEISLWKDPVIRVARAEYRRPFYSVWFRMYERKAPVEDAKIIGLLLQLIPSTRIKIKSLYAMIDGSNHEQKDAYEANGFTTIENTLVASKLDRFFERYGIDNPLKRTELLFKAI